MKSTHVSATKHAPSKVINRSSWRVLQSDARQRGVTVDALLREQGPQPTERIAIELPAGFVDLLKRELRDFASHSAFERIVASALLALDLKAYCEQLAGAVHSNRNSAYRAAVATFIRDHSRSAIALRYRDKDQVQTETFRNPLAAIGAA